MCPRCALPMTPFSNAGVDLLLCPQCKGLWVDGSALARVLGKPAPPLGPPSSLSLGEESGPPCPRCGMGLGERRMQDDAALLVDACPKCEGLFLDRGELERLRRLASRPRHVTRDDLKAFRATPQGGSPRAVGRRMTSVDRAMRTPWREPGLGIRSAETPTEFWIFLLNLPIEEYNPVTRWPVVTWTLIVSNILIFCWQFFGVGFGRSIELYGMVPAEVLHGDRLYTLVTSQFVHGGWIHLLGNMWFLWLFGDNVEDRLGHVGMLALYLAAGVGADALTLAESGALVVPHVGASGCIAGLMAAYVVLFPGARILTPFFRILFWKVWVIALPAWIYTGIWLGVNALGVITASSGVAWWAHFGGFAIGFAHALAWRLLHDEPAER